MSINLGNAGYEAIRALRGSENWAVFCLAVETAARDKLHAALESSVENRVDATAYARAFHDIHVALVSTTKEVNARAVNRLSAKATGTTDLVNA